MLRAIIAVVRWIRHAVGYSVSAHQLALARQLDVHVVILAVAVRPIALAALIAVRYRRLI